MLARCDFWSREREREVEEDAEIEARVSDKCKKQSLERRWEK
jgi:hypothetical protein